MNTKVYGYKHDTIQNELLTEATLVIKYQIR